MRKIYLSMLAAMMSLTSFAQVTFTCTDGKNFGQNEGIDKLFDGSVETKYCQNAGDDCYALVTASEPVYVWGYDMTTANDNEQYGRCVTRWTLYGTNDEAVAGDPNADGWVTLSDLGGNNLVQRKNFYTQRFFCDKGSVGTAYKYFKVVLNEGGFIQVSEFQFCYEKQPVVTYDWVESSDANSAKAVDWLLGQKWEGNNLAGNWLTIKTADDQRHSVKSYSFTTHDDGSWANRAPKTWIIEGSDDNATWTTIDEMTEGDPIENENFKTFSFTPADVDGAYKYIRLTLNSMKGTGWTQVGEFHVVGACETHDWVLVDGKEPTCVEAGGGRSVCSVCGAEKLTDILPPTGNHDYDENGLCTTCHNPNPTFMTAVDGFYQPTTAGQFTWLAAMVQADAMVNIRLTEDVDLTDFAGFGNGDNIKPFKGEFDGKGHWLKNLHIDVAKKNTGLFGMIEDANIHDLGLDNAYVKTSWGNANAGGIAGNAKNATINRVAVSKDSYVEGYDHVGAIVGNTEGNTVVSNCFADITILSGAYQAGGLVGTSNGLTLENSLFTGEVRNNNYNSAGLVALCDSEAAPTIIKNNISAASKIWVGQGDGLFSIINTGGRAVTFENNRVASSTVFQAGESEGETRTYTVADDQNGLTTDDADMKVESFYTDEMGWDMTNDWTLVKEGEYPVLAWMVSETTGIVSVNTQNLNGVYNLAGQKLQGIQKGINIVNGKKVLVK